MCWTCLIWLGWLHDSITIFTQMQNNSNVKATPTRLPSEDYLSKSKMTPQK